MTDEERQVWRATYASAYVAEFKRTCEAGPADPSFGTALRCTCAETAARIADSSVRQLRRWRELRDPECGVSVSEI